MHVHLFNSGIVLILTQISQGYAKCVENPYLDSMGCHQIRDEYGEIEKYNCSMLTERKQDTCFFLGKFYKSSEKVPEAEKHCLHNCKCDAISKTVQCEELKCPQVEEFGKDCFPVGNECCPKKFVCASQKHEVTCKFEGKTLYPGMIFRPEPCNICTCQKGFRGKTEEPFCKIETCVSDHRYYDSLIQRCAPIYTRTDCCPVDFACQTGKEIIETTGTEGSKEQCIFGDSVHNVGARFITRTPVKAICACITPPVMTCVTNKIKEDFQN